LASSDEAYKQFFPYVSGLWIREGLWLRDSDIDLTDVLRCLEDIDF